MQAKEIIGLDLGTKHTGVARASSIAKIAEPLASLETNKVIDQLQQLIEQKPTQAIVLGLPRNLIGDDTNQTKWVRQWATEAKKEIELPFYWQDEALTSRQAPISSYKTGDEHSKAAAIILQDFLDTDESERVRC